MNTRRGLTEPVMFVEDDGPRIYTGTVDTEGAYVVEANPLRKRGVFVQNIDTTAVDSIAVGTTAADCVIILNRFLGLVEANTLLIPGTGSIYLRGTNTSGTAAYTCMEI